MTRRSKLELNHLEEEQVLSLLVVFLLLEACGDGKIHERIDHDREAGGEGGGEEACQKERGCIVHRGAEGETGMLLLIIVKPKLILSRLLYSRSRRCLPFHLLWRD